jgi:hypothetical protein
LSTAWSSFRVKYKWPEPGRLKPEISPRTRTRPKVSSTVVFKAPEISPTEKMGAFVSAFGLDELSVIISLCMKQIGRINKGQDYLELGVRHEGIGGWIRWA